MLFWRCSGDVSRLDVVKDEFPSALAVIVSALNPFGRPYNRYINFLQIHLNCA